MKQKLFNILENFLHFPRTNLIALDDQNDMFIFGWCIFFCFLLDISGRWEKEGTERRKRATSSGRSHMSPIERSVGLAGQLKRCGTEWQGSAHSGHSGVGFSSYAVPVVSHGWGETRAELGEGRAVCPGEAQLRGRDRRRADSQQPVWGEGGDGGGNSVRVHPLEGLAVGVGKLLVERKWDKTYTKTKMPIVTKLILLYFLSNCLVSLWMTYLRSKKWLTQGWNCRRDKFIMILNNRSCVLQID